MESWKELVSMNKGILGAIMAFSLWLVNFGRECDPKYAGKALLTMVRICGSVHKHTQAKGDNVNRG